MAKLVDIYNCEKEPVIKRRQLPLTIYENLTMIMDLNTMGLIVDNPQIKGREYEEFMRKYRILTTDELKSALRVDASDIFNVLNQSMPCVGCRRSVERLFYQLCKSGHPTLDPLILTSDEIMTIREDKIIHTQSLAALINGHSIAIECLVLNQPRWKKSQRCTLHSLEAGTARGWSATSTCAWGWGAWGWGGRAAWRAAWDAMRTSAREHVTLVHFNTLHDTLHNYLRKHRFCADCKTKVLRAYQLLVEEKEPQKEKGYVGALYGGIKRCLLDKHLHLQAKTDYIAHLIARAEPELLGNHRERHAKTLEIAQEEVLICLGICVYERLQRISLRLREEEGTCQILAAVAVEALYRKFETAVELKSGVSKLQLLYDEITQEELTRQQRKEQKKLKRRKKKERQAGDGKCKEGDSEEPEEKCQCEECLLEERDTPTDLLSPRDYNQCYDGIQSNDSCHSCQEDYTKHCSPKKLNKKQAKNGNLSPNEHQDCGYSSGNNGGCCETMSGSSSLMSSPEGSEVACSEGFCNHERGDCLDTKNDKISCTGFTLSLQEMLEGDSEEPEEKCQCEECLLEERDTPTDLLSPRDYNQCYDGIQSNDSCHSCQEDYTKHCSPKKLNKKQAKNGNLSPNEHQDCGYSSGNNGGCCETMSGSSSLMSSPEGSEVACSEGFCNHERGDCLDTKNDKISCTGFTLSLQEMLDTCSSDEEQDTSYIPIEEVLEFKSRRNITEKRQELRQNLRQKFAQLCVNTPQSQPVTLKQGKNPV